MKRFMFSLLCFGVFVPFLLAQKAKAPQAWFEGLPNSFSEIQANKDPYMQTFYLLQGLYSNAQFAKTDKSNALYAQEAEFVFMPIWPEHSSADKGYWFYVGRYFVANPHRPVVQIFGLWKAYGPDSVALYTYRLKPEDVIRHKSEWFQEKPFSKLRPQDLLADPESCAYVAPLLDLKEANEKTAISIVTRDHFCAIANDALFPYYRVANELSWQAWATQTFFYNADKELAMSEPQLIPFRRLNKKEIGKRLKAYRKLQAQ